MKDATKEDSDDEVVLVEEKTCLDKTFDKEVSKQQASNKLVDTKPSQMVCNTCHTNFRKPRDYHAHVLAVCLDHDVS